MIPNILLQQQICFSKAKTGQFLTGQTQSPNLNSVEHTFHMLKTKT
uniref:Uncharacterized protein n=1 Tax=Anguilla anguilla TaxID=7936 RepID=A0A0E9QYU8_ANGAN